MHLSRFLGALSPLEETVKETDGDRSVRRAVLGVVGTEGGAKHGKQESASLEICVKQWSGPGLRSWTKPELPQNAEHMGCADCDHLPRSAHQTRAGLGLRPTQLVSVALWWL